MTGKANKASDPSLTEASLIHTKVHPCRDHPFNDFFCPRPLPFGKSPVLNLTRGPAGIEPPPEVCQHHKSDAIPTSPPRTTHHPFNDLNSF